jgi:hypothetical protein
VARILALADESSKPIQIYVHSPGGHVESVTQSTTSSNSSVRACPST